MIMEGTRPPTGASPTQPYKCGQYVKIKIQTAERGGLVLVLVLILTLTY